MSNTGLEELLLWLLGVALPVCIGYWCMTVFRGKGRSAGAGFALGSSLRSSSHCSAPWPPWSSPTRALTTCGFPRRAGAPRP